MKHEERYDEWYYWIEIYHTSYETFALPEGNYKFTLTYNETQGDGCFFLYNSAAIWFENYGYGNSFSNMEHHEWESDDETDNDEDDDQIATTDLLTTLPKTAGILLFYLYGIITEHKDD